ncbi:tetraspanin-9 [Exaiptasia diaphana]|uniref:Tetraspanin n=1 Tax=Exaiptasia diaphana TaxID=2652724 RepID=A0A913Y341_EXADI|nr:tetraspanin-9 [Exaiptasia diaphana]XP_020913363.1 tetraspanin-9 [Exaiptasia diaphana]KXJ23195.1 Tetraspanin-9 [Exaiptasia diaphana]
MCSCTVRCLKYFVVFFNFVFFLVGLLLIGVGSWAEHKYGDLAEITTVNYVSASRLVIAIGIFIVIIALCGFLGAVMLNKCLLVFFFVILWLLLILEVTGAVLGYVYAEKVKEEIMADMHDVVFNKYGQTDHEGKTKAVDLLQEQEKCCGVANYTNWFRSKYSNKIPTKVPDSCCKVKTVNCGNPLKQESDVYPKGCFEKLADIVYDNLFIIGCVCIAMIIVQLLGMICSIILIRKIKQVKMIS